MKKIILSELKKSFSTSLKVMINIGGGLLPFFLFLYSFKMDITVSIVYAAIFFIAFFMIHLMINVYMRINKDIILVKDKEIEELKNKISQFQNFYGFNDGLTPSEIFPYIYLESHVDREIVFKKDTLEFETISTMKIKLKCNCKNLKQVSHGINIGNMAYDFGRFIPQFESFYSKGKFDAILEKEKNDKTKQNYCVTFSPALPFGEEVEYVIKWSYLKAKFISCDEFYAAKRFGFLPNSRENELFSRSVVIPCEHFSSSVKFPKNYKIKIENGFSVKKKKQEILHEIERISNNALFTNNIYDNTQELSLHITKPITGLTYYLSWQPLSLDELVKIGFLTLAEKEIIDNRIATVNSYKEWYNKNQQPVNTIQ